MASQLAPWNIFPQGAAVPFSTVCPVSDSKARSSGAEKRHFSPKDSTYHRRGGTICSRLLTKNLFFKTKLRLMPFGPACTECAGQRSRPGSMTRNSAVSVTLFPFSSLNSIMFCSCGETRTFQNHVNASKPSDTAARSGDSPLMRLVPRNIAGVKTGWVIV